MPIQANSTLACWIAAAAGKALSDGVACEAQQDAGGDELLRNISITESSVIYLT